MSRLRKTKHCDRCKHTFNPKTDGINSCVVCPSREYEGGVSPLLHELFGAIFEGVRRTR